jgi:hypothetical protein
VIVASHFLHAADGGEEAVDFTPSLAAHGRLATFANGGDGVFDQRLVEIRMGREHFLARTGGSDDPERPLIEHGDVEPTLAAVDVQSVARFAGGVGDGEHRAPAAPEPELGHTGVLDLASEEHSRIRSTTG